MRFAPEYVTHVLTDNFEDAKTLLLAPLMSIHYAHLVMLTERDFVSRADARVLRTALDGISADLAAATAVLKGEVRRDAAGIGRVKVGG